MKQKEQLAAQEQKLEELTLKIEDVGDAVRGCFRCGLRQGGGGRDRYRPAGDAQGRYSSGGRIEKMGAVAGSARPQRRNVSMPLSVWMGSLPKSKTPCSTLWQKSSGR